MGKTLLKEHIIVKILPGKKTALERFVRDFHWILPLILLFSRHIDTFKGFINSRIDIGKSCILFLFALEDGRFFTFWVSKLVFPDIIMSDSLLFTSII